MVLAWPYCLTRNAHVVQEKLNQLEADLGQSRNQMSLGYTNPSTGKFMKASSVQLRNTMRTDSSEDVRKACWEVRLSCLVYHAVSLPGNSRIRNYEHAVKQCCMTATLQVG